MMVLMMTLGIAVIIIMSIFATAAVSRIAKGKLDHDPLYNVTEKPKRGRLMLSDDGELLEIGDDEWEMGEKPKRGHKGQEASRDTPPISRFSRYSREDNNLRIDTK